MKDERFRVFYALWPEAELQDTLARWAKSVQRELGGRITRAETIHLTLAFIGEVDAGRLDALHAIGGTVKGAAFDLAIDRVDCFAHNGVAWAGGDKTPDALSSLVLDLREKLWKERFPVENREFTAHITLLRKGKCVPLKWQPAEPLIWRVERFVLVRSILSPEGSTYSELAAWPLNSKE